MNKESIIKRKSSTGTSCIYFLISGCEIVYVGQSINGGFDRIGSHLKYTDKDFDSYYILNCNKEEIDELEAKYILTINPKLNKCLPKNNRYKSINFILSKYRIWNKDWLVLFIKFNKIKVYIDNYVDAKMFNNIWELSKR